MKRITRNLRDASIEAFILALETANRPSAKYRLQASAILFCNSWELLLKAQLVHTGQNIYRRKIRGMPRETISLDECLGRIFSNARDSMRQNIEVISELRNQSTHFVIPMVPPEILGIYQATARNFNNKLNEWFQEGISDRIPLGMMAITYDFNPSDFDLSDARLRRQITADSVKWLANFQQSIQDRYSTLQLNSNEFQIPVDFKLAFVKSPKNADIVMGTGGGDIRGAVIEVPRDIDRTHPWYESDLVIDLNSKLKPFGLKINGYDIRCVRYADKVRDKGPYVWKSEIPGGRTRYSPEFSNWTMDRVKQHPDYFARSRSKYRQRRQL